VESGTSVANEFLKAIYEEDALNFWEVLDSKGKGYFLGVWFYALGNADLGTVSLLAEDETFLKDALAQIIGDLKVNLQALLENPKIGSLQYTDSQHAVVSVTTGGEAVEQQFTDYIPLVMELAAPGDRSGEGRGVGGSIGMACWKIDTLKCFKVNKS